MTAGRFGAMTLLSAKALRIYADRGLLPPRRVDPDSGYRYYDADQVATGWLIGLLRSADLPLHEIAEIIEHVGDDREAAVARLDRAVAAIGRRNEARHAVLARARLHLRQETTMSTVTTGVETDRAVVSVLCRLAPHELDQRIHDEVGRLRRIATDAGARETGDPFGIFHSPVTDDSDGPLEIVLPVDGLVDCAVDADVRSYRLSGGQVATRSAHGAETDFPGILAIYDEVHAWITSGGRAPIGPPREIWHTLPQDAAGLRLTVAWPFVEVAAAK
ncbi:MerR family transcriptional regulator [Microbacterium radiodurans]|uniref:MerR family transcriptional regulator n=2 Tax=Microbacterium radiodurans TaxID=661398 RepID=A0A5J5IR52_9MICO|nr:MerR family transcriptional regulator [Microbacterium radiodurans]